MPHANDNDQDLYAVEVSDCYGGTDTIFVTGYKGAVETAKRENERDRTMSAIILKVVTEPDPRNQPRNKSGGNGPSGDYRPTFDRQKAERIAASLGERPMTVAPKTPRDQQSAPSVLQRTAAECVSKEAIKSADGPKAFAYKVLRRSPKLRIALAAPSGYPVRRLRDIPRVIARDIA